MGFISIKISGDSIDFDSVTNNIIVSPYKIIKKGDKITSQLLASTDSWHYRKIFDDFDFEEKMDEFLIEIYPYREFILEYCNLYNIEIFCGFSTELEQFKFSISTKQISKIKELQLYLNFSIISFGGLDY